MVDVPSGHNSITLLFQYSFIIFGVKLPSEAQKSRIEKIVQRVEI